MRVERWIATIGNAQLVVACVGQGELDGATLADHTSLTATVQCARSALTSNSAAREEDDRIAWCDGATFSRVASDRERGADAGEEEGGREEHAWRGWRW